MTQLNSSQAQREHWHCQLQGTRQGIGLRPKVLCLAQSCQITGSIKNTATGAVIEAIGLPRDLSNFITALTDWLAPFDTAFNTVCDCDHSQHVGMVIDKKKAIPPYANAFTIQKSDTSTRKLCHTIPLLTIQSDQALCDQCLAEFNDPENRRFGYPFMSCAQCGPRFSILKQTPFDRENTSYADFPMCSSCEREYKDTEDRRFHAQTCSCPRCGPRTWLLDTHTGKIEKETAIQKAGELLHHGKLVTVKTPTGFQLLTSANQKQAISQLRHLKNRPQKPLAVMFGDLTEIQTHCIVSDNARKLLESPLRPIVIMPLKNPRANSTLATLAPGLNQLGCFLPTTALHHLLLESSKSPLVVTSGNLGGDCLYNTNEQAIKKLGHGCRYFLLNDLDIHQPIDDSVYQMITQGAQCLRRARGVVPHPIPVQMRSPKRGSLGMGGAEKTSFALAGKNEIYLSQSFGDLAVSNNLKAYSDHLNFLQSSLPKQNNRHCEKNTPTNTPLISYDYHPNYPSTQLGQQLAATEHHHIQRPIQHSIQHAIQHHESHFYAALNEFGIKTPAVGIIWDGAGLGTDGHIWGGESFVFSGETITHVGQLKYFPLLGGDSAAKYTIYNALSLVQQCVNDGFLPEKFMTFDWWATNAAARQTLSKAQFDLCRQRLAQYPKSEAAQKLQCKPASAVPNNTYHFTSSVGRLFDAVAGLLNICDQNTYEGEAALKLMNQVLWITQEPDTADPGYPFSVQRHEAGFFTLDWRPAISALIQDLKHLASKSLTTANIAHRFHRGLAQGAAQLARGIAHHYHCEHAVFSGGVWQNSILCNYTNAFLNKVQIQQPTTWLEHHIARQVPPNDAGLSVGQLIATAYSHH